MGEKIEFGTIEQAEKDLDTRIRMLGIQFDMEILYLERRTGINHMMQRHFMLSLEDRWFRDNVTRQTLLLRPDYIVRKWDNLF